MPAYADDARFKQAVALLERVERRDVYRVVFETLYRDGAATSRQHKLNHTQVTFILNFFLFCYEYNYFFIIL